MPSASFTLSQARRIALAGQGLTAPRPHLAGGVTMRQVQGVIDRLGLFQIDSVNVLARAHLMPLFSRLGPYDTALLDRAAGQAPRRLVEYWAHEASFVPPTTYRLLHWRQQRYASEAWGSVRRVLHEHPEVVTEVRRMISAHGPMTAAQVQAEIAHEHPRPTGHWGWNWSVTKRALELLFFAGEITSAGRTPQFERRYDLVERVLPPQVLAQAPLPEDEGIRALVEIAARAHGIGSRRCLADYFRIKGPAVARAVDELVEDGALLPVTVRGWDRQLYLHRDAMVPRRAQAVTLLSPFDPVVFERRRLHELFGLHYRIEIYVPAARRTHGYYVLPFLLGERFVARVDLKADRATGRLLVQGAFAEPDRTDGAVGGATGPGAVVPALAAELRTLADWLGLDDVVVPDGARGDLAGPVRAARRGALSPVRPHRER